MASRRRPVKGPPVAGGRDRKLTGSLVVDAVRRDYCDAWHNLDL
jgi:hypothetical protein